VNIALAVLLLLAAAGRAHADCAPALDTDGDGICNPVDNCVTVPNPDQLDTYGLSSGDGSGDACEPKAEARINKVKIRGGALSMSPKGKDDAHANCNPSCPIAGLLIAALAFGVAPSARATHFRHPRRSAPRRRWPLLPGDVRRSGNNWLFGGALDPASLPAIDTTIQHTYPAPGTYTARIDSCCRISPEVPPNAHINNPDLDYKVQTIVRAGAGPNSSPVSTMPPIVICPQNAVCTFAVPASDPDGHPIASGSRRRSRRIRTPSGSPGRPLRRTRRASTPRPASTAGTRRAPRSGRQPSTR